MIIIRLSTSYRLLQKIQFLHHPSPPQPYCFPLIYPYSSNPTQALPDYSAIVKLVYEWTAKQVKINLLLLYTGHNGDERHRQID